MISFFKKNKVFSILFFLTCISFLSGIFFHAMLDQSSREVVQNNIINILKNPSFSFGSTFLNYTLFGFILWILGISVIGILILCFLFLLKVFILSFEFCSFFHYLKIKNIIFLLLYFLPDILFLVICFILVYYSIRFSLYLIQFLFFHKNLSFPIIMKRYSKILLVFFFFSFILSAISTLISSLLDYFLL